MASRAWRDQPRRLQAATLAVASAEIALTVTAAVDLSRRKASDVRGPKAAWWPILFVQPVGPVLYLARGRRR